MPRDYNAQSVPGLDGVADHPIRITDLCMRGDYPGRNEEPIRPGCRVVHPVRGAGSVMHLGPQSRVFVVFDSGITMFVVSREVLGE